MKPLPFTRSGPVDASNRLPREATAPARGAVGNPTESSGVEHSHGWHESSYELKSGVTVVECAWDDIGAQVWSRV